VQPKFSRIFLGGFTAQDKNSADTAIGDGLGVYTHHSKEQHNKVPYSAGQLCGRSDDVTGGSWSEQARRANLRITKALVTCVPICL